MHILIPLDGTLRAETVLHPLTMLVRRAHSPVTVTLVMVQSTDADAAHTQHYLAALKGIADLAHLTVQTRQVTGDPAQRICAVATEHGADLILMASHIAMLDPLAGASVAETVARCAKVPTLIIRPEGVPFPEVPRYTPLTIAILVAASQVDADALQPCVRLAHLFDADLLLLGGHGAHNEADAAVYDALTTVARQLAHGGVAVSRVLTNASSAEELAMLVRSHRVAIIALPLPMDGASTAISTILRDVNAPTLLFHP